MPQVDDYNFDVEVHTQFNFHDEQYRTLFESSGSSPFCSPLWLSHFYTTLCPATDAQPVIVTIKRNNKLVALLPLLRRQYLFFNVIEFADLGVSDYSDFATAHGFYAPAALGSKILSALAPFTFISIRKIRRSDIPKFSIFGDQIITRASFDAHATMLTGTLPEWQKRTLESSFKNFLDRKSRLLGRLGRITLQKSDSSQEIDEAFNLLRSFRSRRFDTIKVTDILQLQHVFEFYKAVATEGAKDNTTATYTLLLNKVPIAVIFGLVHCRVFSFLLMAFDFERYRNYSVGLLVIERTIAARIDANDISFDFMIGDQPYKKDFGTAAMEIYSAWRGRNFMFQLIVRFISRSILLQRVLSRLSIR